MKQRATAFTGKLFVDLRVPHGGNMSSASSLWGTDVLCGELDSLEGGREHFHRFGEKTGAPSLLKKKKKSVALFPQSAAFIIRRRNVDAGSAFNLCFDTDKHLSPEALLLSDANEQYCHRGAGEEKKVMRQSFEAAQVAKWRGWIEPSSVGRNPSSELELTGIIPTLAILSRVFMSRLVDSRWSVCLFYQQSTPNPTLNDDVTYSLPRVSQPHLLFPLNGEKKKKKVPLLTRGRRAVQLIISDGTFYEGHASLL